MRGGQGLTRHIGPFVDRNRPNLIEHYSPYVEFPTSTMSIVRTDDFWRRNYILASPCGVLIGGIQLLPAPPGEILFVRHRSRGK